MKIKLLLVLFVASMCLGNTASGATFKGKVIDADTKQPIVGLVVVASWIGEQGSITGGTSRKEGVKEVLTDKNGEWSIKGPSGTRSEILINIYTFITFFTGTYYTNPPEFVYFKPGYCSYPEGYSIPACKAKIKYNENNTLELPKLLNRTSETLRLNKPFIAAQGFASEGNTPMYDKLHRQELDEILRLDGYK